MDGDAPYQPSATDDAIIDEINRASPSGGDSMPVSTSTRHASDAQVAPDPVSQAVVDATSGSSTAADQSAPPGILGTSFRSIANGAKELWAQAGGVIHAADTPENREAAGAGMIRGARNFLDKVAENPNADVGYFPSPDDMAAVRQQNIADRATSEQQYGDNPTYRAFRTAGEAAVTAPVLAPLGGIGTSAIRSVLGPVAERGIAGIAARMGERAVVGGGLGAGQAAMTSDPTQPLAPQVGTGAIMGAALPLIGGGFSDILSRSLGLLRGNIGGVRPDVAQLADTARQYGVTPPVTALSTNPNVRMVADALQKLPFSGADVAALAKQRQFQTALTNEMGSTAPTLGPATMSETAARLSKGYQDLYANAPPISSGPRLPGGTSTLVNDLSNVGTDAAQFLVGDQEGAMAHVGNAIQKVTDAFQGGSLDPRAYKSLMGANDGTLARIEDAAPSAAQPYLQQIRNAVQDRFAASAGPDAAATLRNLDTQYRVMKTVQPLAAKSTLGDIAPGSLMQQVVNQSNRFDGSNSGVAYTGGGPLGDLGRVGKQFFGHIPDSGTAARLQAYELSRNFFPTVMASLPGMTVGRLGQKWINSPTVAGNMIDIGMGRPAPIVSGGMPYGLLGAVDYRRDREP